MAIFGKTSGNTLKYREERLEYAVIFGGRWGRDSQGLSGKGKIVIEEESVDLFGRQHTAIFFKVLVWLLSAMMVGNIMVVLCSKLFSFSADGIGHIKMVGAGSIGLILTVTAATLLTRYFGSSPYSSRLPKNSILDLNRTGNLIKFKTASQKKYHMFRAASEQDAVNIEQRLRE